MHLQAFHPDRKCPLFAHLTGVLPAKSRAMIAWRRRVSNTQEFSRNLSLPEHGWACVGYKYGLATQATHQTCRR